MGECGGESSPLAASLVQVSGGLDSTACLVLAKQASKTVTGVHFSFVQPAATMERLAAKRITEKLGVELEVVPVPLRLRLANGPGPYIPQRNLVLMALSVQMAAAEGYDSVWSGSRDSDAFRDGRTPFFGAMEIAVELGTEPGDRVVTIVRPLALRSRENSLRIVVQAGIDAALTWSCYGPGPSRCGECAHCRA